MDPNNHNEAHDRPEKAEISQGSQIAEEDETLGPELPETYPNLGRDSPWDSPIPFVMTSNIYDNIYDEAADRNTGSQGETSTIRQCSSEMLACQDNDDISALLDPGTYFSELDMLSSDVASLLDPIVASNDYWIWNRTGQAFKSVTEAIDLLSEAGFCRDVVNFLLVSPDRDRVLETVDLRIDSIRELSFHVNSAEPPELGPEARQSIARCAHELLDKFQITGREILTLLFQPLQGTYEILDYGILQAYIGLLCWLLAHVVLSYTASHCCSQHSLEQNQRQLSVETAIARFSHSPSTLPTWLKDTWPSFVSRTRVTVSNVRLACLHNFLGDKVCVFVAWGATISDSPYQLSISARQFAALWGPMYAHPDPSHEGNLQAYGVDGGLIHRTSLTTIELAAAPLKGEVQMHFAPTSPATSAGRNEARRISRPATLDPFASDARLLIGQPTETITYAISQDSPPGTCRPRTTSTMAVRSTSLLHVNTDCKLRAETFTAKHAHDFHGAGTKDSFYESDAWQASLTAGQYINGGVQKVWKRRPGSTHKSRIVAWCSKPNPRLRRVLATQVGLLMSTCTRNARRVSLWEAVLTAFPEDRDQQILREGYRVADGLILAPYLDDLQWTGAIKQDHGIVLYWPYNTGIPQTLDLDQVPQWVTLLKDSRDSACFATAVDTCLTYIARDTAGDRHVTVRGWCESGLWSSRSRPLLETSISLHPDSGARLPLHRLARLKLTDGSTLEIRNCDQPSQLVAYIVKNTLNKMNELRILTLGGGRGRAHRELLDADTSSGVKVGIIDAE